MASLTTHLRRPDDHGRLAFRPDCPVCRRERLAGAEPSDAVVGHRTQALLAASVLALSSASTTAAVAAEPDQEQEGALAPDPAAAPNAVADPVSDPGGSSTELPIEVVAETEPGEDAVLEQPGASEEAPAPAPEVPAAVEPAPPEPVPTPSAAAPVASPTPAAPPPAPAPPPVVAPEPEPDRKREPVRKARRPSRIAAPPKTVLRIAAPQPEPVILPADAGVPVAGEPTTEPHRIHAAQPGERIHVVRPSESLWSIARDLLGDNASAARIAREVNRLWELNSGRIGTGDPDLLMAGTRLRVR